MADETHDRIQQTAPGWDGSYPPPDSFYSPPWTPSQGFPEMSDKEALDYLASTVLGDKASNYPYVLSDAIFTLVRTGRKVEPYTGD